MADCRPILKEKLNDILNSSGYEQLEYIRFDGSTYFMTDYVPYNDTRIMTQINYADSNKETNWLFGARKSVGAIGFCLLVLAGKSFRTDYATKGLEVPNIEAKGMHTIDKNKNITIIDGTSISHTYSSFTCPIPMAIGATNENQGIDDRCAAMDMYYFKVYDNETQVLDLVPAREIKTSKCGFYNKINKHFYTATVGELIGGPKSNQILIDPDKSLELLEEASLATVGDIADMLGSTVNDDLRGKTLTVDNLKAIIELYR